MAEKRIGMTFDAVMRDLRARKFAPIYLLMGEEPYYIDRIADYIAENVTNNVRQLEGTVKKIKAYHDLNNLPLDVANVSRAIKDMYKGGTHNLPTPALILAEVSRFYSIDEDVIRGTHRTKGTAEARQIAFADAGQWGVGLTFDGVHFTSEGHTAFFEGIYGALKALLPI